MVRAEAVADCDHFYCGSALDKTSPLATLHFWELLELCCSFGQRTSPGTAIHAWSMLLPCPDLSKVCKRAGAEELRRGVFSCVNMNTCSLSLTSRNEILLLRLLKIPSNTQLSCAVWLTSAQVFIPNRIRR